MKSEHQGKLIGHHADHLIANLVDNQNLLKVFGHYIILGVGAMASCVGLIRKKTQVLTVIILYSKLTTK
jgi:hypothetical protein